jgi:predicted enzyme related to lactoylglutathione lyase
MKKKRTLQRGSRRPRSQTPVPIRAVDFVMYCAKDLRRTRAFYQKLFGLKRGPEWNDFWSEFATEPLTLCLNGPSSRRDPMWNWAGPACVAFAVDDVRAAIAACKRRRVRVLIEPVETRVCWMAWIADPDGNRICLHSRKDGTAG